MGIREILGVVDWEPVSAFLRTNYSMNDIEAKRRSDALERQEFYEGRGRPFMEKMIDRMFKSAKNRDRRKRVLDEANWNHVIARVVGDKATVYNEPAKRKATDPKYRAFLEAMNLDEIMRELNRLLVLHEDVWVQYRVRETYRRRFDSAGNPLTVKSQDNVESSVFERECIVDLVPPSLFWAIAAPGDPTQHIATLIDQAPPGNCKETDPHYRLWTDDETVLFDKGMRFLSVEAWPLGRMPGFIASMRPPNAKQRLLALSPASDLVAATKFAWFQAACLLKESASANKQTYVLGDTSSATMGQSGDTEDEAFLPEGVQVQALDRGMDTSIFRDNSDHAAERTATNHGVPPSLYNGADAVSGAQVSLRMIPLRMLRQMQVLVMRRVERNLGSIQSMVNRVDNPELAFSMDGWGIDFGEVQQPLTAMESLLVFDQERRLLLTDTIEEVRRRDPDIPSDEAAFELIRLRVQNEIKRVELTQKLQKLNGGTSSAPGDPTPAQNGQAGQAASQAEPSGPPQVEGYVPPRNPEVNW